MTSTTSSQSDDRVTWEPFTFTSATGVEVAAERGWLQVPERHALPDGPKVRLPVVRLRATSPTAGPPIVWLEGGPGGSGIQRITGPFLDAFRAYGDVVAFDQRGTGAAEPSLVIPGRFDLPATESVDSPVVQRRFVAIAGTIRDEMRRRGIDLAAYNTGENADDVDSLRQALGVEKIVLVAHSYGTHLGLAVIKRHETHVDRAILGGVNGLDQRWREPNDADRWLARVAASMGKDPRLATLVPDFFNQVRRVLAQLEREPLVAQLNNDRVLIGKAEIQLLVTLQSGDIGFVQSLPVLFNNLEKRSDTEQIARAVQQAIRQRSIGTAMTYAMHVASGASRERRTRIAKQAPTAVLNNALNWGIGDETFVDALGVPDLGEDFRTRFRSTIPVLLISATLDGRTSEEDAREVGQQFPRAVYVAIDGASHDFFFRRESATLLSETMGAFLRRQPISDQRVAVPLQFRSW
jgi:pimeloyl-ACP methyl ester carboxylesterase